MAESKGKSRVRLQTPGDVASELARTYRELKSKRISVNEAKARTYLLKELRVLIEATVSFEQKRLSAEAGLDINKMFETPDWANFLPVDLE
jgi:hypothetical protein